jgi:glutathione S-transferase
VTTLYFFWSSPESARVRLALDYKKVDYVRRALAFDDDETFFGLGIARQVPVLQLDDGTLLTDSVAILRHCDDYFPQGEPVFTGVLGEADWEALLKWRDSVDAVLARLQAPVLPGYADIRRDDGTLAAYKSLVHSRFGMTVEELSNDRYSAFAQLDHLTNLKALSAHLAQHRFYAGRPSAADMLLTADLFPLQLLDGVTFPIDLMYYLQRVTETCGTDLREGLLAA